MVEAVSSCLICPFWWECPEARAEWERVRELHPKGSPGFVEKRWAALQELRARCTKVSS